MTDQRTPSIAVIIPVYNEEKFITDTLEGLRTQKFDSLVQRELLGGYRVVVVDNNSTDGTADIVRSYMAEHPDLTVDLITETEKGSGCAADTGARFAIDAGAKIIARTDADSIPTDTWLDELVSGLYKGKRLVGGRVRARHDEGLTSVAFNGIGLFWHVGHALEWYKTRNNPPEERRSFAVVGNNMAIDADMYLESGGFPRTKMDDVDDDSVLQRRVRERVGSSGIGLQTKAVVHTSLRRLHAYGVRDFIAWYGDGDRSDKVVDVR
ncbi:glycosyltransferase [Williamsia sterculiae]|uniref:Glycosyl transferase family 2 n=1 Tax=Williamsia sterculiae TaxID=1344003 RepID=A0A1N7HC86_9NOCA|nr:glycosyltransferase family 2 protein [Williamsia sterculiae]SIS22475.1 Glycosyl transferase family 2 [Williamsia sterculiae]